MRIEIVQTYYGPYSTHKELPWTITIISEGQKRIEETGLLSSKLHDILSSIIRNTSVNTLTLTISLTWTTTKSMSHYSEKLYRISNATGWILSNDGQVFGGDYRCTAKRKE